VTSAAAFPPLPCAPGASPFHIKGLAYRGLVRAAARLVPGGIDGFCRAFADKRLSAFVAQPFLASGFYDLLPIYPLTATLAALLRTPFDRFVREGTFEQARYDAAHVFRRMFESKGVEDIPDCVPRLEAQYYDFGRTEARMPTPGLIVLQLHDAPEYVSPWLTAMKAGYAEEAARILGASRPHCTGGTPVPGGTRDGHPLVSVWCELRWSNAS
jgi:hypothetical protein